MNVPHELFSVAGLGVIGFIGEAVLADMGKKTLGIFWSIILNLAGGIVAVKYFAEKTQAIGAIFSIHF